MATVTIDFGDSLLWEEFTEISEFLNTMYEATATVEHDWGGELRNVEDLTEDDYGRQVMLEADDGEHFDGILEGSYQVPHSPKSRVLIVDGFAHKLNFGIVRVL